MSKQEMEQLDPGFMRVWRRVKRRSDRAPTHAGRIRLPACPKCHHQPHGERWLNGWETKTERGAYLTISIGDIVDAIFKPRVVKKRESKDVV